MKENRLFVPLRNMPFTSCGSTMFLATTYGGNDSYGYGELKLGSNHSGAPSRNNTFFRVQLTYRGRLIPCSFVSTPTELRLESDWGAVKFCFPEPHLLRFKGEGEVGLRIYGSVGQGHQSCRDMLDGSWQICWANMNNWLIVPLGGKFHMDAPYDYLATRTSFVSADWQPDGGTPLEGVIEESETYAMMRSVYPGYDEGLAASAERFEDFMNSAVPPAPGLDADFRLRAAWTVWCHLQFPQKYGKFTRRMFRSHQTLMTFAMAWHQYYHALTFRRDRELTWDLIQSLFDHQLEDGQIPEAVSDRTCGFNGSKPPIQGFTFLLLMEHSDVFENEPERIAGLYEKLGKNLEWWMKTHDLDHNGVPEYQHADESGWDDCSAFKDGPPIESPDLVAYMALGYEALARFAAILGDNKAAANHTERSQFLVNYLVANMWDGEKFTVRRAGTFKTVDTWSISLYIPAILGKRLPEAIRDKLCADLMNEDMYLSPEGIRTESLSSLDFSGSWTLGAVIPPAQFIICSGLEACGHMQDAREVTRRYVEYLARDGFHIGDCTNDRLWLQDMWCSWTASICLYLADRFLS